MNRWRRAEIAGYAGVCLGLLLILPTIAAADSADGKALFEKRCVACHKLPDPDSPPPEGWEQRLEKMAPLAKLKEQQKADILAFLTSHVQASAMSASLEEDKAFFEEKCSRCHTLDRIFLEPLTDESRRHVVSRMQAKSGTDWLSDADVERVLNYLSSATLEAPASPALAANAGAAEIFAARCQACHSMERIAVHLGPGQEMEMDWSHVVNRMRGKAPQWITETESQEIIDYLDSLGSNGSGE